MLLGATEPVEVRPDSVLERVHMENMHWQPLVLVPRRMTACCAMLAGMERKEGPMLSVRDHVRRADGLCHRRALARQIKTALRATLGAMGQ